MAGLVPFNKGGKHLAQTGYGDFYNMLDDFFSDNWLNNRSLYRDTFKIDIEETDQAYCIEAELPGVKKEEIDLGVDGDNLRISINHTEELKEDSKNYIHRERRSSAMSRRINLADARLDDIKAKLKDGVLTIQVPKDEKAKATRKIKIE